MLRLAALRTMGVLAGDDAAQDASGVARFLSAAADDDEGEEAVQAALAAAAAADGLEPEEGADETAGQATHRLAAAGAAC
eukprot:4511012-Pleurochrysis_carterae.AAC.1